MKHCIHKSVMIYYKTPPITSKRALPNLYLFKMLPPTPKKSVLPQRSPQNDQLFYSFKTPSSYVKKKRYQIVHLFKTPLLLQKKQLLPQEANKMTKFLYLFKKRPPPSLDSYLIVKKYKSDSE